MDGAQESPERLPLEAVFGPVTIGLMQLMARPEDSTVVNELRDKFSDMADDHLTIHVLLAAALIVQGSVEQLIDQDAKILIEVLNRVFRDNKPHDKEDA